MSVFCSEGEEMGGVEPLVERPLIAWKASLLAIVKILLVTYSRPFAVPVSN